MVNPRDFCRVGLLDRPWPGLVTGAAHNALAGPRIRQRSTSTYAWLPATLPPGSSSSCPIRTGMAFPSLYPTNACSRAGIPPASGPETHRLLIWRLEDKRPRTPKGECFLFQSPPQLFQAAGVVRPSRALDTFGICLVG